MPITEAPPAHHWRWQHEADVPLTIDSRGPAARVFTVNLGMTIMSSGPTVISGANPGDLRPWADSQAERIEEWVKAAMRHVETNVLPGGAVTAEIPGVDGAWIDGDSAEEAIAKLPAVLFDWASLGIDSVDNEIPIIDGVDINRPH